MDLKKKISHIWYYYKIPIIVGICVVALTVSTIVNKRNTPKYDHGIAIVSKFNYPSEDNIKKILEAYQNKFGGSFNITIYNVELTMQGEDDVIISKLGLDLANKISDFYLVENYDTFKKAISSDIEFSDIALVKDIDWLNNLGIDNFYYLVRK